MKSNLLRHSLDISRNSGFAEIYEKKNLKLQLNEIQSLNKFCRERNKMLERQIEELNQQLGNMNKINRKLMKNSGFTDSQDIEQVYTAVYKKELVEAYKEIDFLKLEIDKIKRINEVLTEENTNLKNKMQQYRKYVAQLSSKQDLATVLTNTIEIPITINKSLNEISSLKSIVEVFDYISLRLMEISQKNTIYLCSSNIHKAYSSGMKYSSDKTRIGKMFLIIHGPKTNEKAMFSGLEQVQASKIDKDYMLIPGIIRKEVDFVIQCREPNKGNFNENDEKIVSLFGNYACRVIQQIMLKDEEKALKGRLEGILSLLSILATTHSLDAFANRIDKELARFFNFEASGIVFIDNISNQFFIFGYSSKPGEKFGKDVIRLPVSMGITSESFITKEIKIYQNLKNKAGYSPEIDNISATGDIRNCIMCPVIGPESKITGILQIVNKITGKINAHDCKMIKELSQILGYMIYGITQIEQAMDITTRMKSTMSTLLLNC